MPTTASHLSSLRRTSTRWSWKLTCGALATDASRLTSATPPGTGSSRGRSGAAGACARATRLAARAAARSAAQPSRHRLAHPDRVLEATLALPAAARDARIEAPVGEARLDLLADGDRRAVREQAAVRTSRHDREAARERGKRTHGIQRALRERQAVRGARYALAHRVQEPRVHSLVPEAMLAREVLGRATHEPLQALRESQPVTAHGGMYQRG